VIIAAVPQTEMVGRTRPIINVEQWRIAGGGNPCPGGAPLVLSVASVFPLFFRGIPISSTRQGHFSIELQHCTQKEARVDVKADHLELTLVPVGTDRPISSVKLPPFPASLYPLNAATLSFMVRDIAPGYYRIRLSGSWRVQGPGISQSVTPVLKKGSSDIALFMDHARRTLPAVHRLPHVHYRGVTIPLDWVDHMGTGPPPDNAPWMLVQLRARLPLTCQAGRDWYVTVRGGQIAAQGRGFRTGVPQVTTGSSEGVYIWDLMPLPAETVRLEALIGLDVRACRGSQPVLAKSTLGIEVLAPPAYHPPASVRTSEVAGVWESEAPYGPYNFRSQPLEVHISISGGTEGSVVTILVEVTNVTIETLTLTSPLVLNVRIQARDIESLSLVWEGRLPPLQERIGPRGRMDISFDWNRRDASGQQVPPGAYYGLLKLPIVADFALGSQPGHQTLESTISTSKEFFITH